MTNWIYQGREINTLEDFGENVPYGFIYILTHKSGKKYIGKKSLFTRRNKKLGKKEIKTHTGVGRKPKTKLVISESDWKYYYGSNILIKEMIKQGLSTEFTREIIHIIYDKKLLSYYETKCLFNNEVLEHPNDFWNDNILGKFFTKDLK